MAVPFKLGSEPLMTEAEAEEAAKNLREAYPELYVSTDEETTGDAFSRRFKIVGYAVYAVFAFATDPSLSTVGFRCKTMREVDAYIHARTICERLMETVGL